jgi:hypothetical protein
MINKKLKLGVLVLAAVTVFTATAFAANSNISNGGYDEFKQIMKNSQQVKQASNANLNGAFTITDNGKVIAEMKGDVKGNCEGEKANGNVQIKLMGKEQDLSFYKNGEDSYLVDKTNDKSYQLINMNKDKDHKVSKRHREVRAEKPQMGKASEALMDYLVGDLKSQFELTQNNDGTKSITLDLDQNEIPVPLNLLVVVAAENRDCSNAQYENGMDTAKLPFLKEFSDLGKDLPKLKQDVKLTGFILKLNVDEKDQIKSFDVKISTTGNDVNGTYHELTFSSSTSISDINNTSVDTFNPNGKTIETIDAKDFDRRERD